MFKSLLNKNVNTIFLFKYLPIFIFYWSLKAKLLTTAGCRAFEHPNIKIKILSATVRNRLHNQPEHFHSPISSSIRVGHCFYLCIHHSACIIYISSLVYWFCGYRRWVGSAPPSSSSVSSSSPPLIRSISPASLLVIFNRYVFSIADLIYSFVC